jgi:AcrR family transcriptional regulator
VEKERKLQILKAAQKRFARHGLNKTTLEEVARDLRIGKATIYHYFSSKDELFFDTVSWEGANYIDELKSIFNNEDLSIKERFLQYLTVKENAPQKYKLVYKILTHKLNENAFEKEELIIDDLINKEKQIIEMIFNSIKKEFKADYPRFIVLQSWGIMFGKLLSPSDDNQSDNLKEIFLENLIQ